MEGYVTPYLVRSGAGLSNQSESNFIRWPDIAGVGEKCHHDCTSACIPCWTMRSLMANMTMFQDFFPLGHWCCWWSLTLSWAQATKSKAYGSPGSNKQGRFIIHFPSQYPSLPTWTFISCQNVAFLAYVPVTYGPRVANACLD